jgi:septal ring factor EnvC (AmiA/AmiB activator)
LRRPLSVLLLAALLTALSAAPTGAQDAGTLRNRIGAAKARERTLSGAVARLGRLERQTSAQVAILEGRVAAAQSELDIAEANLLATQRDLGAARRRLTRLRKRLVEVRGQLAVVLRERYMGGDPDFLTVVLHADGFPQLLETLSFLHRVERSDTHLLDIVRRARADAAREERSLTVLAARRQRQALAVRVRRDALAGIAAGLRARRDQLARAHAARLGALTRTRAGRRRAERALGRLLAARAAAARATGPGGPWAIPWPIVQCESGGQNLPPNWAGASGYYQILDTTWRGLGGSTPHAYQASKAEQDRLAARLWAGGAGAHNWVCAGMVDA